MHLLKFGPTSLTSAKRFNQVADLVITSQQKSKVAVVLSAPKGIDEHLGDIIEEIVSSKKNNLYSLNAKLIKIQNIFAKLISKLKDTYTELADELLRDIFEHEFTELNKLIKGSSLLNQCPLNIEAKIRSKGTILTIACMKQLLIAKGQKVSILNPQENFISSNESFLDAQIDIEKSKLLFSTQKVISNTIYLMPAGIGGNVKGETVLLGKNGADYSAVILSVCMDAKICEIWSDLEGVYSCDKNLNKDAKLISNLSYKEAMELSYIGSDLLHPKTIAPIAQYQIPLWIKNFSDPKSLGTLISEKESDDNLDIKAITVLDEVSMISILGASIKNMEDLPKRIFMTLSRANIKTKFITQSSCEYSLSFCILNNDLTKAIEVLNKEFLFELEKHLLEPIDFIKDQAIISLIGDGIKEGKSVASRFFSALNNASINTLSISQGGSERSLSAVISKEKIREAVNACYQSFFKSVKYIDLFLIGCGGVGGALIDQVYRQQERLIDQNIQIRIFAIANSQAMLMDPKGIDLNNWRSLLKNTTTNFSLVNMQSLVNNSIVINPVIVDCTHSEAIASRYLDFFGAGFHIVTANKKANTSSMDFYEKLRIIALKKHRKFMYDTNVGAGLPVIENMQNLFNAGDQLIKFNGILSGSLSFIFGKLDEGKSFSEITELAMNMGFTEADPRDDLSGIDVARKLLILAREAGMELSLSDVEIEKALPTGFDDTGTIEEFMDRLVETDGYFKLLHEKASRNNQVLRYIGSIENGKCRCSIKAVDASDPLNKVKEGENALAFYSQYYQPIPLVLRGYGAGTQVTAAGVFADILRVLK